MRPIDADALKEQVEAIHKAVNTRDRNPDYDTGFHSATSQIMGLIAYMPTVEMPRGEWIKTFRCKGEDINTGRILSLYYYDCPKCKYRTGNQGKEFYFCPNCGADMRGEGE